MVQGFGLRPCWDERFDLQGLLIDPYPGTRRKSLGLIAYNGRVVVRAGYIPSRVAELYPNSCAPGFGGPLEVQGLGLKVKGLGSRGLYSADLCRYAFRGTT